jgi:DNA-binding transcriptional MocR family regulator
MISDIVNVLTNSKASAQAKLVLVGIANHVNEDGEAWPSRELLASYANCSVRTITRHLAELEALGELVIVVNAAPTTGRYRPNLYRLPPVENSLGWTNKVKQVDKLGNKGSQLWPSKHKEPLRNLSEIDKARIDRSNRLAESKRLAQEMADAKANAEPMPECKHNKQLLRCSTCCVELAESEITANA